MKVNEKTKDIYLPKWVCGLGIVLLISACVLIWWIYSGIDFGISGYIADIVLWGLGISAILCWKNQWVIMQDQDTFIYSTMFGRKIQYRFSEIESCRENVDSFTLILKNGKVHIERCAIKSDRFIDAIAAAVDNEE